LNTVIFTLLTDGISNVGQFSKLSPSESIIDSPFPHQFQVTLIILLTLLTLIFYPSDGYRKEVNKITMRCPECNIEMKSQNRKVKEVFKGDTILLEYSVWVCPQCHEEIVEAGVLDTAWKKQWEIYKQSHGIPSPENIKNARERLGLTGEELAQLLGKTRSLISKLENGERNLSDSLLSAYRDYILPGGEAMMPLLAQAVAQNRISREQSDELTHKMDLLNQSSLKIKADLIRNTHGKEPDPDNGSTTFDEELFCGIASYIIIKKGLIDLMGLLKLFFYLDTEYYEISGKSLSGFRYLFNKYGPTPLDYYSLVSYLQEAHVIKATDKEYQFESGNKAEHYLSNLPKDKKIFFNKFFSFYSSFSSCQLSTMSHQEPFWQKAGQTPIIRFHKGMIKSRIKK